MIAILDTDYADPQGHCACVVADDWTSALSAHLVSRILDNIAPYQPGAFYQRELPCLLHTLELLPCPVDTLIIDGYVWLGDNRPGLGHHLYEALKNKVPIVGIAKTYFEGVDRVAQPLLRGSSQNPLWITAIGCDLTEATRAVASMAGEHRLPTLVKLADQICRSWPT